MLAITAEGPSSDIMNRRENPTGHTYLAPYGPVRFIHGSQIPWSDAKPIRQPNETELLRAQLETARKALERIALGQTMSASIAARALSQIGAGQKGGE